VTTYPHLRLRRTRKADWSRRLVRETRLSRDDLIWTIVLSDGHKARDPVPSMPGIDRINLKEVIKEAKRAKELGIPAIALFPHINPKFKDAKASEALNSKGLIPEAVRAVKAAVPDIGVIVDVALDPYTDHGHDGLMQSERIINDPTIEVLAQSALILAEAGADIVAPSDMMDGRVEYASGFYGPYRDAIGTAAALKGDKATYQMDSANTDEALREVEQDILEGADLVMVKPGMPYLDIIRRIKDEFAMPTYAYQVSGEYAMLMAAAQNGWLDEKRVIMESLTSFKRLSTDRAD